MLAIYLSMLETEEDKTKFLNLYEAYEKKVYAVALQITGNPAQAEDAAQQTWLQLLRHWNRLTALGWQEAGSYTVTTAKNAALDILRIQKRVVAFPDDWNPPARENSEGEYQYIIALIRALPEAYRRILELKLVEEQSNREIAKRLGIKESTVGTRVMRGKAMLREQLEKEGFRYE